MSCEVTNVAQELQVEELKHAVDRHIANVTSLDGQCRTTNEDICWEFHDYCVKRFTREPGLNFVHFDTYQAAECKGRITEEGVQQALKTVGTNKTPWLDVLPYEVYLWLSPMFVPLLATI